MSDLTPVVRLSPCPNVGPDPGGDPMSDLTPVVT